MSTTPETTRPNRARRLTHGMIWAIIIGTWFLLLVLIALTLGE